MDRPDPPPADNSRASAPDPDDDPFRPPDIPTEVFCLHCHQEYQSYLIEWRQQRDDKGELRGFWCCPTPGCSGIGFGFDILPADPDYESDRGGWMYDEDEIDDDDDELFDDEDDDQFDDVVDLPFDATRPDAPDDDEDIPF